MEIGKRIELKCSHMQRTFDVVLEDEETEGRRDNREKDLGPYTLIV